MQIRWAGPSRVAVHQVEGHVTKLLFTSRTKYDSRLWGFWWTQGQTIDLMILVAVGSFDASTGNPLVNEMIKRYKSSGSGSAPPHTLGVCLLLYWIRTSLTSQALYQIRTSLSRLLCPDQCLPDLCEWIRTGSCPKGLQALCDVCKVSWILGGLVHCRPGPRCAPTRLFVCPDDCYRTCE